MMIQEAINSALRLTKKERERIIIKIDNEEEGITREDLIIQTVQYYLDGIETKEDLEERVKSLLEYK